jgi:sulfate adenylyltransferase subunit 2
LSELESESIEIIREVAATAAKPVMLYSIGKDSSVMLRLAQKAFLPRSDPISAAAYRYRMEVFVR